MSPKYTAELREDRYLAMQARAWEREYEEALRDVDDDGEVYVDPYADWCDDI